MFHFNSFIWDREREREKNWQESSSFITYLFILGMAIFRVFRIVFGFLRNNSFLEKNIKEDYGKFWLNRIFSSKSNIRKIYSFDKCDRFVGALGLLDFFSIVVLKMFLIKVVRGDISMMFIFSMGTCFITEIYA